MVNSWPACPPLFCQFVVRAFCVLQQPPATLSQIDTAFGFHSILRTENKDGAAEE